MKTLLSPRSQVSDITTLALRAALAVALSAVGTSFSFLFSPREIFDVATP